MRKIIVSNLVTLDGYYEGKGRSLEALFEYFHMKTTQTMRTWIFTMLNACVQPMPFCSVAALLS